MYAYAYLWYTSSLLMKPDFDHNMLGSENSFLTGISSMGYTTSLLLSLEKNSSKTKKTKQKKLKLFPTAQAESTVKY